MRINSLAGLKSTSVCIKQPKASGQRLPHTGMQKLMESSEASDTPDAARHVVAGKSPETIDMPKSYHHAVPSRII